VHLRAETPPLLPGSFRHYSHTAHSLIIVIMTLPPWGLYNYIGALPLFRVLIESSTCSMLEIVVDSVDQDFRSTQLFRESTTLISWILKLASLHRCTCHQILHFLSQVRLRLVTMHNYHALVSCIWYYYIISPLQCIVSYNSI
jgi:hypothetical protein